MADKVTEDELQPEATEGFKVGAKKTIDEYNQLDQNDESLNKWKAQLLGGTGTGDPNDKRTCVILSLGLEVPGRQDIVLPLEDPKALETLKNKPFVIKEGATYKMKVKFRVQNQILSGLKYLQVVKRMGVPHKTQEMIGSYAPNKADQPFYETSFEEETAPSGMLFRGSYTATSKFVDDDNITHLQFDWAFDIKKDW